jgi:hypothetical protein
MTERMKRRVKELPQADESIFINEQENKELELSYVTARDAVNLS